MRNFEDLKIAVAGTGYVGLSIATLLSQHHKVMAVDIIPEKVEMINNKKSPIQDEYIEKYLAEKELDLTATLDAKEAYSDADFVVIAVQLRLLSSWLSNITQKLLWLSSLRFLLAIQFQYEKNSTVTTSFLAQSFCVNLRLFMITCIRAALLLEQIWRMQDL